MKPFTIDNTLVRIFTRTKNIKILPAWLRIINPIARAINVNITVPKVVFKRPDCQPYARNSPIVFVAPPFRLSLATLHTINAATKEETKVKINENTVTKITFALNTLYLLPADANVEEMVDEEYSPVITNIEKTATNNEESASPIEDIDQRNSFGFVSPIWLSLKFIALIPSIVPVGIPMVNTKNIIDKTYVDTSERDLTNSDLI
jgi:hypothetical protein